MSSVFHRVSFNSENNDVNITNDTIGFSTFHKLSQNEKVVYETEGSTGVGGISTGAFYYVGVVDNTTIKLYNTYSDSNSGINTVSLTSFGVGGHKFKSSTRKNIVSSIVVTNSGSGYQNKQRTIPTSGISTALNQFIIPNHGYESKEIVRYSGSNITGITSTQDYYVVKVDDNTFRIVTGKNKLI